MAQENNKSTPTAIALLSGGLDSIVALRLAMEYMDVTAAITFDYGQRASEREKEASRRICRDWSVEFKPIPIPWLGEWTRTALVERSKALPKVSPDDPDSGAREHAKAVWVPNRNGTFAAIAASLAESTGASRIVMGLNAEEARTFPDNSEEFLRATNDALALSTLSKVMLESPTVGMTKDEIAERFIALKVDPDVLWCCYEGDEKLCGHCESCARAIRAFKAIDRWDVISGRFE